MGTPNPRYPSRHQPSFYWKMTVETFSPAIRGIRLRVKEGDPGIGSPFASIGLDMPFVEVGSSQASQMPGEDLGGSFSIQTKSRDNVALLFFRLFHCIQEFISTCKTSSIRAGARENMVACARHEVEKRFKWAKSPQCLEHSLQTVVTSALHDCRKAVEPSLWVIGTQTRLRGKCLVTGFFLPSRTKHQVSNKYFIANTTTQKTSLMH